MKPWVKIALLFLLLIPDMGKAQSAPMSDEELRSRWGVLLNLAGRDFATKYFKLDHGSSWRWEVPGQILVERVLGGLGPVTRRFVSTRPGYLQLVSSAPGAPNFQQELVVGPDGTVQSTSGVTNALGAASNYYTIYKEEDSRIVLFDGRRKRGGVIGHGPQPYLPLSALSPDMQQFMEKQLLKWPPQPLLASFNSGRLDGPASSASSNAARNESPSTPNQNYSSQPPANVVSATAQAVGLVSIAGPRLALVVGNGAYGPDLGSLANPVNDADSIATALRSAGFSVEIVKNADQKTLKRAISSFGERLRKAGPSATGLFFYAGHGIQSRGINYLVPIGANVQAEADVDLESVAADTVLRQMEEAGSSTNIVILDACRNMPLTRSFRNGSRGLARMEAPNGSFIAYSTAPGAVAADGEGRNSPFVAALVPKLATKGVPIETLFREVRKAVVASTSGKQTPWDSSSLLEPFVFVP
jgi:hypothetical protein